MLAVSAKYCKCKCNIIGITLIYIILLNLHVLGLHSWWNSQLSSLLLCIAFGMSKITRFDVVNVVLKSQMQS